MARALEAEGWRRQGKRFYYRGEDAFAIIELRMSDHGNEVVIDIGFVLTQLSGYDGQSVAGWHISVRPTFLFPQRRGIFSGSCRSSLASTRMPTLACVGQEVLLRPFAV